MHARAGQGGGGVKASHNARWAMASQFGKVGLQVGGLAILARLLSPAEFGLMALATTISTFASMFRDLGLSSALIQKENLESDDLWTAHWVYLVTGMGLTAILAVVSPSLSVWMGDVRAADLLVGLAFTFPLSGLGGVQQARLEREGRFRTLALTEIAAAGMGLCVAVAMAIHGVGAASLVGQTLVATATSSGLLWLCGGVFPAGRFRLVNLRRLVGFGGKLTLFNVVNYFARNADNILIGRRLGSDSLGVYAQAYRIMMLPLQNLTFVAGRALLPIMSRERMDQERFWNRYLDASGLIAVLAAPFLSYIALLRFDFVQVFLGPNWGSVPPLLPWLCFAGSLQSLVSLTGTVLVAQGKVRIHLLLGTINALLQVTSFFLGIRYGLSGLVQAYAVANLLGAGIVLGTLIRILRGDPVEYVQKTVPPFVLALACFVGARTLVSHAGFAGGWPMLILSGVLGVAGYALVCHRFLPWHYVRLSRILPNPWNKEVHS